MAALKVLVVDDSPTMRQLIIFALRRIGDFQLVEAGDGLDGLKKLGADKFDLIMTDLNMPIMDGLKLIAMVRNDPNYRTVPIVIITTEGAVDDRDRALALGADACITKPIQNTQILDTVRGLLNI
jgi:two-component system chemotaxis response regulator CheY